jgi:hypothetical protein
MGTIAIAVGPMLKENRKVDVVLIIINVCTSFIPANEKSTSRTKPELST